jgi:hypothetical protein
LIKKIVAYFIVVTAGLYGLRYLHWKGLLMQEQGYYATYRKAFLEKNDHDVLFLGSSRAITHYNTAVFDSLTGCNSFNLSMSGASSGVSLAALKAYLKNSKAPKYILYETDFHNVHVDRDIMEFNNYFPFLKNEVLLEEFNKIDPRMKHFYYDAYYSWPYTGYKNISTGLRSWFHLVSARDRAYYKGYVLNDYENPSRLIIPEKRRVAFTPQNEKDLRALMAFCKQMNIKLILVTSPMFAGGKVDMLNKDQVVDQLNQIVAENKLQHWNLSSTPYCDQRNLFLDHFHMNYRGARLFTCKLAGLFSNNCQKNPLKP